MVLGALCLRGSTTSVATSAAARSVANFAKGLVKSKVLELGPPLLGDLHKPMPVGRGRNKLLCGRTNDHQLNFFVVLTVLHAYFLQKSEREILRSRRKFFYDHHHVVSLSTTTPWS